MTYTALDEATKKADCKVVYAGGRVQHAHTHVGGLQRGIHAVHGLQRGGDEVGDGLALGDAAAGGQVGAGAPA